MFVVDKLVPVDRLVVVSFSHDGGMDILVSNGTDILAGLKKGSVRGTWLALELIIATDNNKPPIVGTAKITSFQC